MSIHEILSHDTKATMDLTIDVLLWLDLL